jgi:hypothetical protein
MGNLCQIRIIVLVVGVKGIEPQQAQKHSQLPQVHIQNK